MRARGRDPRRRPGLAAAAVCVVAATAALTWFVVARLPETPRLAGPAPGPRQRPVPTTTRPDDPCQGQGQGQGQRVGVASAAQLKRALATAAPGQVIELADAVYKGNFVIARSGRAGRPIALCGSARAVLQGPTMDDGYVLHLDGASDWALSGFGVTGGKKGVVVDGGRRDLLLGLTVWRIGEEGIHLRRFSSDNVVRSNAVRSTGLRTERYGEAIYVGSARENWCTYTRCQPDRSDRNTVTGNRLGPGVTAEGVDVKEGTTGGVVEGNHFDGGGMTSADSWVNVKGNGWLIRGNVGWASPGDGFQVHVRARGWGEANRFVANTSTLGGGYAVNVDGQGTGTVVACDNRVLGAGAQLANVRCS